MNNQLTVQSSLSEYPVFFLELLQDLVEKLDRKSSQIAIIDRNIANLYSSLVDEMKQLMPVMLLDATEENKTLNGAEKILQFFSENSVSKSTAVIAIGGGIVQDISSFVAHIYYRGLDFIYVPTTLLAMSDSCIGAKCGLNYLGFKNQLGAFHPPKAVLICPVFLKTLSETEWLSGYGEILKLSLIGEQKNDSYQALKTDIQQFGFQSNKVANHIFQSLSIKKKFIEEDEFDVGIRRLLNYGHTFGHALELAVNYTIPHGEAVARGMDIVNYIAYQNGYLSESYYNDIHQLIEAYFHAASKPRLSAEILISHVKKDKKMSDGEINMALLEKPGQLFLKKFKLDENLKKILKKYLDQNPKLYIHED